MRIRNGDSSDPGWEKVGSGIRDKHPGSATLLDAMKLAKKISHFYNDSTTYFKKIFFYLHWHVFE